MSEHQPLYLMLYHSLHDRITGGEYSKGEKLPTEKELAEQFGVSNITSKKALELLAKDGFIQRIPGKGSFVLKLSDEEPKAAGPKPGTLLIGVVVADFMESYGTDLLSGIEEEASANGCFIVPIRTHGSQKLEDEAIDSLIDMGIDGIIVIPVHGESYNPKILKLILDGFPIVLMDCDLKGIPNAFVGTENKSAAKMATDYLLKQGHRNIGILSSPLSGTVALEDRVEGFIMSHAEHGVKVNESIWETSLISSMPGMWTQSNIEADRVKMNRMFLQHPEITCLFVTEYNLAELTLQTIRSLHKSVPEDISILCFDGPFNYFGNYFFTHIRQKEKQIGSTAVRLVLEQLAGDHEVKKIYLDAALVIGKSVKSIKT
ncbi:MAG: GntR family transcriptional regulator [Clostridiales bacterium]|nr:GntR family transcriptional regulator [Clostridiales bacterium]